MRLLLIGLFIFVPFATAEDSTKKATLDDLSFLTGSWRGTIGGDVVIEEVWSAPRGGSMMGMFRIIAGDKTTLYEFLAIEDSAAGPSSDSSISLRATDSSRAKRNMKPSRLLCRPWSTVSQRSKERTPARNSRSFSRRARTV